MWRIEENFRVKVGGNTFVNARNLILYKDECLFTIKRTEDGFIGIDFDVFDEKGERLATIRRGNVVQGNTDDYIINHPLDRYFVVEKATGKTICDVRRRSKSPDAELEVSVRLYTRDGFLIDVSPNGTNLKGVHFSGNTFNNVETGIAINSSPGQSGAIFLRTD